MLFELDFLIIDDRSDLLELILQGLILSSHVLERALEHELHLSHSVFYGGVFLEACRLLDAEGSHRSSWRELQTGLKPVYAWVEEGCKRGVRV